jgi:hypothetical protein
MPVDLQMDKETAVCLYVCVYVHATEYYSVLKRSGNLITCHTWVNMEDIMLNEMSQAQRKHCMMSHVTSKINQVHRDKE